MTFFYSSQAGTWLSMDMYRFISQFLVATKCKEPSFIKPWHFNLYWTPFSIFALRVTPTGDLSTLIPTYVYETTRLPTMNWVWTLKLFIASILHVHIGPSIKNVFRPYQQLCWMLPSNVSLESPFELLRMNDLNFTSLLQASTTPNTHLQSKD